MKYLHIVILFFLIKTIPTYAQQYPLFTNYILNGYGYNPAIIGATNSIELRGMNRTQWLNMEGKPQTNIVSVYGKMGKSPLATGMYFFNDQAGRLRKTGVTGMLAYSQKMSNKSTLNVGVSGGYYKVNLLEKHLAQELNDGVLDGAQRGMWIPDLSAGVYYKQEDGLFLGFSIPQLYQKKLYFDPSVQRRNYTQLVRQYHALVGYSIPINEQLSIEPSVLMKASPNVPLQFDASFRGIFNKMFWVGGTYRTEDAVAGMAGVDFKNWTLAYSYDMTVSPLREKSAGSHEIVLGLRFGKDPCKDTDKDGICDKEDKCPKEAGIKENEGCPEEKKEKKKEDKCDGNDRDADGICDVDDKCPDLPGPKANNGCPFQDRDGDGIRDDIDKCPDIPGFMQNAGCPLNDRDKDGIIDDIDPCPDVPGTLQNMGCPPENDRDKDGVKDQDDLCPDVPGPKDNKGCPIGGDRDKDGIPDAIDGCPNTAGSEKNRGCPEVTQAERDILSIAARNLYFDTDKSIIRPSSYKDLNNVARILKQKKDWKIRIEGHADSRGTEDHNLKLSARRAEAVKNYLISRGISPLLIHSQAFGAAVPATKEKNEADLQMNRRVEIEFVFD
jgi:type IX secretion system PorP/SprF family membrane protein